MTQNIEGKVVVAAGPCHGRREATARLSTEPMVKGVPGIVQPNFPPALLCPFSRGA